ncbi:CRAL-TRIO domain-containing protein [Pilobolus umbonatus]|nr:CRAL-TRIO domain-containing protein [Pilobolus umbonatus]
MTQFKIAVNDGEALPGHWGNLTPEEMVTFKNVWRRLLNLFDQKVEENQTTEAPAKKGGFFGFGKREVVPKDTGEVFFNTTTDPSWMSLPLDKALPLIPGEKLRKAFWNLVGADNADATLLRYCRARKWDENAIYNMLTNTLRWRISMRIDDIVSLGENGIRDELNRLNEGYGDAFVRNLHKGKVYIGGPDKNGRSICFINVYLHLKEDQPHEVIKMITLLIMESNRIIAHQPVESACILFNLEHFTLKNMDFEFVKFLVHCFEQHYPETLGICLIHKAPWVFSTIWGLITPLLDPVVASKINFTNNVNDLSKFIDTAVLPDNVNGVTTEFDTEILALEEDLIPGKFGESDTLNYRNYLEAIKKHEAYTKEWVERTEEAENVVSDRRAKAVELRHARYKAENDIRGATTYSAKKIGYLSGDRFILDFQSPGWEPLDITDAI